MEKLEFWRKRNGGLLASKVSFEKSLTEMHAILHQVDAERVEEVKCYVMSCEKDRIRQDRH